MTARRPAARAVRLSNVTGVQVGGQTKTAGAKKSLTVRVERDTLSVRSGAVENNRATTSRASAADVSIVDKLSDWEKKNDRDRTVARTSKG